MARGRGTGKGAGGVAERRGKLDAKGIAYFTWDGVLARLTGAQSESALKAQRAIPMLELGAFLAREIRDRVTRTGKLGDGQPAVRYGQKTRVRISREYAQAAGVSFRRYSLFRNEDRFHKGLRSPVGSYVVTGGMWRGLEVRPLGRDVVAEFGGRSQGRGKGALKRVVSYTTKGGLAAQRTSFELQSQVVTNRDKGGKIWRHHKINPLSYTQGEAQRIGLIVLQDQSDRLVAALTGAQYSPRFTALRR